MKILLILPFMILTPSLKITPVTLPPRMIMPRKLALERIMKFHGTNYLILTDSTLSFRRKNHLITISLRNTPRKVLESVK